MALEESGGSIVAHSLYSSVKLGEKTMAWFPEIAACAADYTRPGPKTICLLHPAFRGGISSRIAVNALVFPAVDPALKEPFLEPLSSGESFRRLVPSTILQMPGAAPSDMSFLVRLCRRLPGYVLHLGSRRDAAVALVGRLIANKGSLPLPGTAA